MLIFTSENFEKEVLQSDKPVLVDFFATWCGPCKTMHPVLEELDLEEDFKVGQVDIDEYPELVSKYRIMSVPFFIVFKNGEVAGKTIGVQSKEELLAAVRRPDSDSGRHRHRRPDRRFRALCGYHHQAHRRYLPESAVHHCGSSGVCVHRLRSGQHRQSNRLSYSSSVRMFFSSCFFSSGTMTFTLSAKQRPG